MMNTTSLVRQLGELRSLISSHTRVEIGVKMWINCRGIRTTVLLLTYCLYLVAAFTRGGLSRHNHNCDVSWVVTTPRSPVIASLHLLALQLKPSLPGLIAPERPLFTHTLPVGFNPGDATGSLIGRGVLVTPPFVGPFCRRVGTQSTTQPWRAHPLTTELQLA